MGRPSTYSSDRGKAICKRLAGGESLTQICTDTNMPSRVSVYRWIDADEDFCNDYARAREQYADHVFDGLFDLADNATPQNVQVVKLQIDTRKWCLARMAPRKYGEKTALEVSGEGGGPISVTYDKAFEGV